MKVMFFVTSYEIGGASAVAKNLLEALRKDGVEVTLLVEKLARNHYPVEGSIKLIDLGITPRPLPISKIFNIVRHHLSIRRHVAIEAPDAVLSFAFQANCSILLALLFKRGPGPRVVISEHTEEMFLNGRGKGPRYALSKIAYRSLMYFLYRRADRIVAVSKSIGDKLARLCPERRDKIRVIYNPVDIRGIKGLAAAGAGDQRFKDRIPHIGTIARLSPEKGIKFLIEGFAALLKKTDARLTIVGEGAERADLDKAALDLGVRDRVTFTGLVKNPFGYLSDMDVFVLSSLWEGFPVVILEAMTCGVPVVASDASGGVREVITDGVNGLLIRPGSSSDITASVYSLLSQKEKREKIIEEAHKTVKRFDISGIKDQYKDVLFNQGPMKNILFLHNTLEVGGAEMMRLVLLRNLDRKKYNVSLCCLGRKGALGEEIEKLGYTVDELNENPNSLNLGITRRLAGYLNNKRPDILHSSLFNSNFHSRLARLVSRVPFAVTEEHGEHKQYNEAKFMPYVIADFLLSRFGDFIVCCSEELKTDIVKKEKLPKGKVVSIENCLDRGMYGIKVQREEIRKRYVIADETVFICTAALKAGKGHEDLITSLAEVKKAGYTFRCFLAGEGTFRNALETKCRELDMAGEIIFLGNVDNIADYLNASDVFVLPSVSEGLSIALMEAMFMGLAPIVTDVGANSDLVSAGSNGIVIPAGAREALKNSMIFCLNNKDIVREFGMRSRSVIETRYSCMDKYTRGYYELWDKCGKRKR